MPSWLIILLIVLAVVIGLLVLLYFAGRKLQKRQAEQQSMLEANKQTVSLLVIDKKRMKVKDAQLPASVISQIPKVSRNMKASFVKVKIGPQLVTLFCDEKIYDSVPVKKEVKAEISGMYLMSVKGVHGTKIIREQKKKGRFKQALEKAQEKAGAKPIK
ncbi:MAG: hypothetical protein IKO11_07310 [Lachnospiraceae bacterium]|nr:hypothetical protein [Lachnospiraceae bacterium]